MSVLETPDGRYIVVNGRLWRRQRPDLEPVQRDRLARDLMGGRRAVRAAKRLGDADALTQARSIVDTAKARAWRTRTGVVDGLLTGSEPAHGHEHKLRGPVRWSAGR